MASISNLNDVGNIKNKRQYTIDDFLNQKPPSELKAQDMEPASFDSNNAQPVDQPLPKIDLPSVEQIKQSSKPIEPPILPETQDSTPSINEKVQAQSEALKSLLDPYINKYQKQQGSLENNRQKEQDKLSDMDKMSNDEKMAQALLAILPGLIGAGLGAAAVGGVGGSAGLGALQGLAGGLQGSTNSLQNIKQEKQQKRQEIRENIKNIDDKLEKSGLKEEARAGLLEERKIQEDRLTNQFANQKALEKIKQDFESGMIDKKAAIEAENAIRQGEIQKAITALNTGSAEKREGMQNSTSVQVAKIYAGAQMARGNGVNKPYKIPESDQKFVDTLSVGNAKKLAISSQIDSFISNWDQMTDSQRLAIGGQLIKVLNSSEGPDAVGAEEVKRLGSKLQFAYGNFNNNNPTQFGRDLKGFLQQAKDTSLGLKTAIGTNNKLIENTYNKYGIDFNATKPLNIESPNKKEENLDADDRKLIDFALNNPDDPRSQSIKQHYGL